jgi:hypothetical protein
MAVRPSADEPFGPAIHVPSPPNTAGDEYWPWLWDDGAGTVFLLSTNGLTLQAAPTGCFGADPGTRACFSVSEVGGGAAVLDAACSTPAGEIVSSTWQVDGGAEVEGPELELGAPGRYQVTLRIATEQGTCDYHSEEVEVSDGPPDPRVPFVRADANAGGKADLSDAAFILNHLFLGDSGPPCEKSADADDSGVLDITDAVYLLGYLFLGGPSPPPPFPDCGLDPTGDNLGCELFPPCSEP